MRTVQETYQIIKDHLLIQNEKCTVTEHSNICTYHTVRHHSHAWENDGKPLACAIGILLPRDRNWAYLAGIELYHETIVYSNVGRLIADAKVRYLWDVLYELGHDAYNPKFHIMLANMQYIHDVKPVSEWEKSIANYERVFKRELQS